MKNSPLPRNLVIPLAALVLIGLACQAGEPTAAPTVAQNEPSPPTEPVSDAGSVFDGDRTAFGFYPVPPEGTIEAMLKHFGTLGEEADFILIQPNIFWEDFVERVEGASEKRTNLTNQTLLARQNGLEWVFVVDPLNGLNRREFFGLPEGWEASFGNPDVREAFSNFTLWIVREFEPRYLGLASEINTYMDAHPDDVENFVSLYREVYERVKAEAPDTQIFVTFQWDDLNNMFAAAAEGRPAGQTNWDQVDAFGPYLDLWVISSYPYFAFPDGEGIAADYYTPLLERTDKPLAVAEGGWITQPIGPIQGDEAGQTAYLQALHDQLGDRLDFWVYLVLSDFNMDSFARIMRAEGRAESDIEGLGTFASVGLTRFDGTPKPALALWNAYRGEIPRVPSGPR
ncbi:MAG: hypothetical protein IIA51_11070 [Chloroflexi bacterium]|nr:hypothetical protein [Chloroflexota bacterium]